MTYGLCPEAVYGLVASAAAEDTSDDEPTEPPHVTIWGTRATVRSVANHLLLLRIRPSLAGDREAEPPASSREGRVSRCGLESNARFLRYSIKFSSSTSTHDPDCGMTAESEGHRLSSIQAGSSCLPTRSLRASVSAETRVDSTTNGVPVSKWLGAGREDPPLQDALASMPKSAWPSAPITSLAPTPQAGTFASWRSA